MNAQELISKYEAGRRLFMLADLSGADLSAAFLLMADVSYSSLSGANLSRAVIGEANLSGAHLALADLSGARVTPEQLATAESLELATMRDGRVFGEQAGPEPGPRRGILQRVFGKR